VIVAVNKMDLIGYGEAAFRAIETEFSSVLDRIAADTGTPVERIFVPVSALAGDNIVHRSHSMPWYAGPSLLELLEQLPSALDTRDAPFRFPVQRVLRPITLFADLPDRSRREPCVPATKSPCFHPIAARGSRASPPGTAISTKPSRRSPLHWCWIASSTSAAAI